MNCTVYELDLTERMRRRVGLFVVHSRMNKWLKDYGDTDSVYEVWKGFSLYSRWCWKPATGRWGENGNAKQNQLTNSTISQNDTERYDFT